MESNRIYRFDNLKVFMILGIVAEHALLIYNYPRELELVWGGLISWLMPLFTIISGYWYKKKPVKVLANSYLKPMVLMSGINFIVGFFFLEKYSSPSSINLIGYSMWYLVALFIFSNVTSLLINKINIFILFILSIIAISSFIFLPPWSPAEKLIFPLSINRYISFYPFYLLGIMYKKYEDVIRKYFSVKHSTFIFAVSLFTYIVLCYKINGLAWASGFYLYPGISLKTAVKLFMTSYILIAAICISLINLAPDKSYFFTKYGSRTMNVYLLHMLVVFSISYGVFSHQPFTFFNCVLNVLIPISICTLFFSDKCSRVIQKTLSISWPYAMLIYLLALSLVNKSFIVNILS